MLLLAEGMSPTMNTDIRVSVALPSDPKLRRLRRALGSAGVDALLCLWCWTGQHRPSGVLKGMSASEIEEAVGWGGNIPGEPGAMIQQFLAQGTEFLDQTDEGFSVHDWEDHQSWASGAEERSDKASRAGTSSWTPEARRRRTQGAESRKAQRAAEIDDAPSTDEQDDPDTSSPTRPSPSTSSVRPVEVVEAWNEMAAEKGLRKWDKIGDARRRRLTTRLKDKDWPWLEAITYLRDVLDSNDISDARTSFVQGTTERGNWKADLEWFTKPSTAQEILEGRHDPDGPKAQRPDARTRTEAQHSTGEAFVDQVRNAVQGVGDE